MVVRSRENGADTPTALIGAAEYLFGKHGLEGVSLRAIAAKANAGNNFAVQYHFGDKSGLLRAIFEHRLAALELQRVRLLGRLRKKKREHDAASLLEALLRPISEVTDEQGRRSYAAFLLRLNLSEESMAVRSGFAELAPVTTYISDLLRDCFSDIDDTIFQIRYGLVSSMFLSALIRWDLAGSSLYPGIGWEAFIRTVLKSCLAALAAPPYPAPEAGPISQPA